MIIILVYFIIGAIATAVVNRKQPAEARKRWIKYFVYVLIVFSMLKLMEFGLFLATAVIILLVGGYEIIRVGWHKGSVMSIAIVVYLVIAFLFFGFAKYNTPANHYLVYVVVFVFDGFSQISGQLFGKRKLAPKISPGKTIEGLIGGLVITVATAAFIWNAPLEALIICVAALAGDLLASYYKRKCGVKDYSNLIPGHGGVLDRFDSFIFAGAVCLPIY